MNAARAHSLALAVAITLVVYEPPGETKRDA